MLRRRFFAASATGAAILTWPSLIARAFGQVTTPDDERTGLRAAIDRATALGRPVLVIVIPDAAEAVWARGQAFGELLNHGDVSVMAELALAEVVCAHVATVRELLGSAPAGEPLMIVIETASQPPALVPIDDTLAADPQSYWVSGQSFEEFEAASERVIDERIATLSRLVHRALAGHDAMLARRVAEARARLGPTAVAEAERALAVAGAPPDPVVQRAPALVALAAARAHGARRDQLQAALARQAVARIRSHRIPGSYWASSAGCGVTIEEAPDPGFAVGCGMGHVPERSRRFLHWAVAQGASGQGATGTP